MKFPPVINFMLPFKNQEVNLPARTISLDSGGREDGGTRSTGDREKKKERLGALLSHFISALKNSTQTPLS